LSLPEKCYLDEYTLVALAGDKERKELEGKERRVA
jgi:hypothetical protein